MKSNGQQTDRLPPHSLDAEAGVLGCLLLDADAAIPECSSISPESMYDLRHRQIFTAMLAMHDARIPIDTLTLSEWLQDSGKLDAVGGLAYLQELPDKPPSPSHAPAYAKIVAEKARLRTIIRAASNIVSRAYDAGDSEDIEDIIDEAERDLIRIGDTAGTKSLPSIGSLMTRAVEIIENYHSRQGALTGLSTGFSDLDKLTNGLQNSDMIVIAARPGNGKTSIAIQIAETVAIEQRLPVAVFSLEMSADALAIRMLCSRARVNLRNVREGFLAERDIPRITCASAQIAGAPIYIDDSSTMSVFQLRTKARRMASQFGLRLLVIDYLQLLHSTSRKADNRQQEIADISRGIKALAKELNIPIIALSQLNRDVERDGKRRPRLADLRESGALEQDSDFVGLLYRPTSKEDDDSEVDNPDVGAMNLYIAKQRNGVAGVDVNLTFIRSYTRFEGAAKISSDDDSQAALPYRD
jgi:replicative DNA helicase